MADTEDDGYTIRKYRIVQTEGSRLVSKKINYYKIRKYREENHYG